MSQSLQEKSTESLARHIVELNPLRYLGDDYLVVDFEIDTSYGDFGHPVHKENQMLLACWWFRGEQKSVWGNELELGELFADLDQCSVMVAHNAKYELGWLMRSGYEIRNLLVFDTKIAEYVLGGNLKIPNSLNDCAIRRGIAQKDPVVDLMMSRGFNPVEIPRKWLEGRCHKDVRDTRTIFLDQRQTLHNSGRLAVQFTRCLFTPVLAYMEQQGMMLDKDRVEVAYAIEIAEEAAALLELNTLANGINWNSPKQVAEYLYTVLKFPEKRNHKGKVMKTDSGQPLTDADTIAALPAKTAEQKKFKEVYVRWAAANSALSKYLDFYKGVCEEYGGVFYAEFNQTVTKTHRLSSSGMKVEITGRDGERKPRGTQFQNQPRKYKPFFRAKKDGWLFCEWDGSGLEFRTAGILGKDDQIKEDINNPDFDPHTRTASIIFQQPYEELRERLSLKDAVAKEMRTDAKAFTFKPLYGGQSGTEAEQAYYRSFNERYWRLVETQQGWLMQAYNSKVVVLPWGMRYYFPHLKMDRTGYIEGRTNVFNYPIQGLATAEIIPVAASFFWHIVMSRGLGDKIVMVNSVHDSVLCEVHPDFLDVYIAITIEAWKLVYSYFDVVYTMKLEGLPLGTEITYGTHWADKAAESVAYNIWNDGRVENG